MAERLRKELGFLQIFAIAAGAMVSSGLFVLPALAYARVGSGLFLAYIVAAIAVLPAILSKAELSTAMPRAGGTYFFIDRSLGSAMGTLGGLASWLSLAFKSAFALVGLGIFFELTTSGAVAYHHVKLIACGFLVLFVYLNIVSVKLTSRSQVAMVIVLLLILGAYVVLGLPGVQAKRCLPIVPKDLNALFATAGMVFVSYGGVTKVASLAEEVRNPGKTIPLAMLSAWFIVSCLYGGVVVVTVGVLHPDVMSSTHTPISLGGNAVAGPAGLALLTIAGILAVFTTANAGILAASRTPMAMARDDLLPPVLGRVNAKFRTPHYAILTTGLFMLAVILFLDLAHLVEVASALMILLFVFVNLSVIVMRESKIGNYRPRFKSPLYPWLQILGIVAPLFLLVEFGTIPLAVTGAVLLVGLLWYTVYARPRASRESGLIYILQRLVSHHFKKGGLRKELRQIVMERDEIVQDRFDRLVQECVILDLESHVSADEFFKQVSAVVAEKMQVESEEVHRLLWERERESSTVITATLAIPHIVVPGEKKFDLVIARSKDGIAFDDEIRPVHTVFVLAGTTDERNFHLKSLAAIAHIAQDSEFEHKWLEARHVEELRDVILLAERRR